jgi:hypothetical protein
MADPVADLAESMWVTVPLRMQRRFSSLRGVMGDGHVLALVPPLAVVAPIVVAVSFGLAGALGSGFDDVYSESLLLMASLIALGAFSGQLGLIGLASFSICDFLIGQREWTVPASDWSLLEQLVRSRLPLLISYLLLSVAVIVIPRLGKNIALGIGQWRRIPPDLAWLVSTPVVVLVSWLGLQAWASLAPTLMRPFFVWTGGAPTFEAIRVFQVETSQLVAAGVSATVLRQVVNALFIYIGPLGIRLSALEARSHRKLSGLGAPPPRDPTTASRLGADVASALVASMVLSGILETRRLWFGCLAVFLVVRLLRSGTIRFGLLDGWKELAARVPVVARLGAMWLGAVVYRSSLTNEAIGSYRAMAFAVLGGVLVSFLIFPGQPTGGRATDSPGGPVGPAGPVGRREVAAA